MLLRQGRQFRIKIPEFRVFFIVVYNICMEGFENKNMSEVPKKRDGYEYTDFDIQEFEKLKKGSQIEFIRDGRVLSGIVEDIHSINEIKVSTGETNETYSYGIVTTLAFEDIKYKDTN